MVWRKRSVAGVAACLRLSLAVTARASRDAWAMTCLRVLRDVGAYVFCNLKCCCSVGRACHVSGGGDDAPVRAQASAVPEQEGDWSSLRFYGRAGASMDALVLLFVLGSSNKVYTVSKVT